MAIKINLEPTEAELFCSSKWWGDPDLPADMEYPLARVEEEGETYDYPLTFLCQIDCEDIAPLDPEGLLPHQGMFYVFAGIDEFLGLGSPFHNGRGEWDRKQLVVKYTKSVNMETFRSAILVDDDDNPLTEPALKMTFEPCEDDAPCTRLSGNPSPDTPDLVSFLQVVSGTAGLEFPEEGVLRVLWTAAEHAKANWKRVRTFLSAR